MLQMVLDKKDSLQVSINLVNKELNDLHFLVSEFGKIVRESKENTEKIEQRIYLGFETAQNMIQELSEHFGKLSIYTKDKDIPNSMFFCHQIPIQHVGK